LKEKEGIVYRESDDWANPVQPTPPSKPFTSGFLTDRASFNGKGILAEVKCSQFKRTTSSEKKEGGGLLEERKRNPVSFLVKRDGEVLKEKGIGEESGGKTESGIRKGRLVLVQSSTSGIKGRGASEVIRGRRFDLSSEEDVQETYRLGGCLQGGQKGSQKRTERKHR